MAQGHASKCTGVPYTAYEFYKALTKPQGVGVGVGTLILLAPLCVGVKKSKGEDEEVISVVGEG